MCIEYHILVNMYHVSAQGVDERMINVLYYYYYSCLVVQVPVVGHCVKRFGEVQYGYICLSPKVLVQILKGGD